MPLTYVALEGNLCNSGIMVLEKIFLVNASSAYQLTKAKEQWMTSPTQNHQADKLGSKC